MIVEETALWWPKYHTDIQSNLYSSCCDSWNYGKISGFICGFHRKEEKKNEFSAVSLLC